MNIENITEGKRLLAAAAIVFLLVGGGGVLIGRTFLAPSETVITDVDSEAEGKEMA